MNSALPPRFAAARSRAITCIGALWCLTLVAPTQAQQATASLTLRVTSEGKAIEQAEVRSGKVGARTDEEGEARLTLPAGEAEVLVHKLGFAPDTVHLLLHTGEDTTVTVELHALAVELQRLVVTATRAERRVEDEPTRVEVLGHEEVEERTAMMPASVAMLLSETGGVKIAQTSPAFGAANIRVQGLRGRYTELLSDGLPLFGLTTEGLGLLQIPPMDLQHVELIKGAASALYGPTALGGVVNLVSRRPTEGPALHQLLANQTSRDATDAIYYGSGHLWERWSYTVLGSGDRQSSQDLDRDGWADLPSYQRLVLRPRLFWTSPNGSSLFLTSGFTAEDRTGGGLVPTGLSFAEERITRRADAGAVGRVVLGGGWLVTIRGSATGEWWRQRFGDAQERDRRTALFGEAAVGMTRGTHNVIIGAAVQQDALNTQGAAAGYDFTSVGLFAQDTWTPSKWFGMTASGRLDLHNEYGTFVSPRVSILLRPSEAWNVRLSAGGGAYAPTPLVEGTEEIGLARMRPFVGTLRAERGRSISADVGGGVGALELYASVYASVIEHPAALRAVSGTRDSVELANLAEPTRTRGVELVAVYRRGTYRLTGTYTYSYATEQDPEIGVRRGVPLTPQHSGGLLFTWELKDDTGIGLESFYTGRQPLAEDPYRTESRPYVIVGAIGRWRVGRAKLFLNSENITGVRQTNFEPLLRPAPGVGGRWTVDAWAPLDGRVVNAGVRIDLSGR